MYSKIWTNSSENKSTAEKPLLVSLVKLLLT